MIGKKIVLCISVSGFLTSNVFADIKSDMENFWSNSGNINVTSAGSYKSQSGGYYTLGSVSARTPVRSTHLATVQLPSVRAGCSGIDMFSGGLSHINKDQLVSSMKAIASNAKGYAFKLALETLSPKLAGVMAEMQQIVDKVNQANINSCQQAAALVGSVWAKESRASQKICEDIGTAQGIFADRAAANHGCSSGGKQTDTLNSATGAKKEEIPWNTNLAWEAIRKVAPFNTDDELAELVMSITGTVVAKRGANDNANKSIQYLPSLGLSTDEKTGLWVQLLEGSKGSEKMTVYSCDTTVKCLNPTKKEITVSKNDALLVKIQKNMQEIQEQIEGSKSCRNTDQNKCFTDEQHALIEQTPFPIYKLLNAYSIYGESIGAEPSAYSGLVAYGVLKNYLLSLVDVMERSVALNEKQGSPVFDRFQDNVVTARNRINREYETQLKKMSTNLDLVRRINYIDQMVKTDIGGSLSQSLIFEEVMNNSDYKKQ